MNRLNDVSKIIGQRFHFLTVLKEGERIGQNKKVATAICACDCGETKQISVYSLIQGVVKSCGCWRRHIGVVNGSKAMKTHGMNKTPEHNCYWAMKKRCYSKSHKSYSDYGGRGIKVCDRWLESFENFYADMGPRPTPKHSLDRIDVNGNYEPSNCRWASESEQCNNRRSTVYVVWNGVKMPFSIACLEANIPYHVVWQRMKKWNTTFEEAVSKPYQPGKKQDQ